MMSLLESARTTVITKEKVGNEGLSRTLREKRKRERRGDAKNLCKGQRRAVSTEMMICQ